MNCRVCNNTISEFMSLGRMPIANNFLDHLKDNVHDDIEHIRDLKDDIKDDHEEEKRAEKEKRRHDESVRRRSLKNRLRRVIRGR